MRLQHVWEFRMAVLLLEIYLYACPARIIYGSLELAYFLELAQIGLHSLN